jgi:hypothetical protein
MEKDDTEQTVPAQTPVVSSNPPQNAPVAPSSTNGFAITSLVLGILAFCCGFFFMGIVFGVLAIIFGIMGIKKPQGKGMGIAGIILGSIGLLSGLLMTILFFAGLTIFGNAVNEASKSLDQSEQTEQEKTGGKKAFSMNETANFVDYEVKVNTVQRNYTSPEMFIQPADGKEYIVVNVTVKNISGESKTLTPSDFKIDENGVKDYTTYVNAPAPAFETKELSADAVYTGNIVYEVTKGATDLKLSYDHYSSSLKSLGDKTVYTIAL